MKSYLKENSCMEKVKAFTTEFSQEIIKNDLNLQYLWRKKK